MCCIFTCCGWMIDLIQRLWTFTMSCCISSAVCCALLTAAIAGIALGYNYSLAEYFDLKETSVPVYLKRDIFDDEIGGDMDWRRSGHQPVAGIIGENIRRTGESEDENTSIRSSRKLDDFLYKSEDRYKFEDYLTKLTVKPPAPSPPTRTQMTVDIDKNLSKYSMGSLKQVKALQSLINMKSTDHRRKKGKEETKTSEYVIDERYLPHVSINSNELDPGRKFMLLPPIPEVHSAPGNSARLAVPQEPLDEQAKWRFSTLPRKVFSRNEFGDYDIRSTYPMPVTQRADSVRPSRSKPPARPKATLTTAPTLVNGRQELNYPKSIHKDMDTFKDKLLFEAPPRFKDDDFINNTKDQIQDEDDYGDAVNDVPMRKKRLSIVSDYLKTLK